MTFIYADLLGNRVLDWIVALALGGGTFIVVLLARRIMARRFFKHDARREDQIYGLVAQLLVHLSYPLVAVLAVYIGFLELAKSEKADNWIAALAVIAVIAQLFVWGNVLISFALNRYQNKYGQAEGDRVTTLRAVGFIGRLILGSVALLLALDNIPGVKITTLIASLGIGGIAVAMAVQSILADLFASLSIVLDKPFVIGDFIIVDTHMGTVEYIGLKTTRIRSLSGEQLIFSNSDLLKSRIRNYKRMAERRVVFTIGVTYQTGYEKLKQIPGMIRDIIEAQSDVRFDRAHFKGFDESALTVETVFYVLSADYTIYMDIQQAINLEIFRRFESLGIAFAYPTRTVHFHSENKVLRTEAGSQPPESARA